MFFFLIEETKWDNSYYLVIYFHAEIQQDHTYMPWELFKENWYTLREEALLSKCFCLPLEKSALKGKNLLHMRASKFFPFRVDCFSEGP